MLKTKLDFVTTVYFKNYWTALSYINRPLDGGSWIRKAVSMVLLLPLQGVQDRFLCKITINKQNPALMQEPDNVSEINYFVGN